MTQRIPTFENFQYNNETQLFELSSNSTLYHRSLKKYKVGDIITPGRGKKGTHWTENDIMEIGLEEFRKENFPNRPPRSDAVYSSVIPKSRFTDKGYLYVVRSIGNFFMTDSILIDKLNEDLYQNTKNISMDYQLTLKKAKENPQKVMNYLDWLNMKKYWEGVKSLPKKRWGDLEILSDKAEVIQVIEDAPGTLRPGMDVTVTDNDKLKVKLIIYNNEDKFDNKRKTLSSEEMKKMINYIEHKIIDGKVKSKSYDKNIYEIIGFLRKGAKLQLSNIRTSKSKNIFNDNPKQKYLSMNFNFYIGKKLYKREDKTPLFSFDTYMYSENLYDWGLYLKT